MFRLVFLFFLSFTLSFGNENISKTSELELFLFKVGFDSLLKDVDVSKNKINLNENEITIINQKIKLIMEELYKNRVVLEPEKQNKEVNTFEIDSLKSEIELLKEEIKRLKEDKKEKVKKTLVVKQEPKVLKSETKKFYKVRVASLDVEIFSKPYPSAKIISKLKKDEIIKVEYCDDFGWCKILNEKKYIKKYLVKKF